MPGFLLLASLAVVPPGACGPAPGDTVPADSLRSLYDRGRTYAEFLAAVRNRREMWRDNSAWGKVDPDQLTRARALPGRWRLLVVAEDACGDSANTIPYVAALADSVDGGIDLRIVSAREGRAVQEAHRTHDGRTATPTVIVLDADGHEAGCWVERPRVLAAWVREHRAQLSEGAFRARFFEWYTEDRGRETIRDLLEVIEGAGAGKPCLGNT